MTNVIIEVIAAKEEVSGYSTWEETASFTDDNQPASPEPRDGYKATVVNGRWTRWSAWGQTEESAQRKLFRKIIS